jgi:hypothetical protein
LDKAQASFSFQREIMDKWTSSKIMLLAIHMSKVDWYHYLVESGFIIPDYVTCYQCEMKMSLQPHGSVVDGIRFICANKVSKGSVLCLSKCSGTRSVRFNTWFYQSKLKIVEILLFTYFWWHKTPMRHVKYEFGFSDRTLCDWASFCREVAIDQVFENSEPIGGDGCIVEIDESKFGKSMSEV